MQSPVAVSTLKRLKDGEHGHDAVRYAVAALFALAALAAFWSAIANNF